jgi:hypothetical protein
MSSQKEDQVIVVQTLSGVKEMSLLNLCEVSLSLIFMFW